MASITSRLSLSVGLGAALATPVLAITVLLTACDESLAPGVATAAEAWSAGVTGVEAGMGEFTATSSTTGIPVLDIGPATSAWDINERGIVAGAPGGLAALWSLRDGWVELGKFEDGGWSAAQSVNNRMHTVGVADIQVPPPKNSEVRAVLWTAPWEIVNLGTLGGPEASVANDINERDQVVGFADAPGRHAYLWTSHDGMMDLGTIPGQPHDRTEAMSINDRTQVVGFSFVEGTPRAFLWTERSGMTELPRLPGKQSAFAHAINNRGDVVGWSGNSTDADEQDAIGEMRCPLGDYQAVLWSKSGDARPLGTLGGPASSAYNINERGQVVGWSYTTSGACHAFLWTEKGGMVDLGTLPDSEDWSWALGINNSGQIVGMTSAGYTKGLIWTVRGLTPDG
jgi:probable HAF family extracellular repeat protein